MTADLADLLQRIQNFARTCAFHPDRDTAIYQRFNRDPDAPVFVAGNLASPICLIGRDLGRDEVRHQQPLIGAAGQRVRRVLHDCWCPSESEDQKPEFARSMERICFTNTVPYKPIENKPFSDATRAQFRPFVEELLTQHFQGTRLMPLGNDALAWFGPYAPEAITQLAALPAEERFTATLPVVIAGRSFSLEPLPHPSPLSGYTKRFPDWLRNRLLVEHP